MKIFTVGRSTGYARFLENFILVDSMKDADILLFTGGEDISPSLYSAKIHYTTYYSSYRDAQEVAIYKESFNFPNIKMRLGICRGAQLLCALNGGLLVQDVDKHAGTPHNMINKEGEIYNISSLHHQMLYPYNLSKEKYEIIFHSFPTRGTYHAGDKINWLPEYVEPEVVYFPETKSLGIQGHPEMMDSTCDTVKMLNNLIKTLIKNA